MKVGGSSQSRCGRRGLEPGGGTSPSLETNVRAELVAVHWALEKRLWEETDYVGRAPGGSIDSKKRLTRHGIETHSQY